VTAGSIVDAAIGAVAANSSVGRQIANAVGTVTAGIDIVQSLLNGADPGQIKGIYQVILMLQSNRALFDIYTGKRTYKNMVCTSIHTESNDKTANALIIVMECHQVILVDTKITAINKEVHAEPEKTAPVQDEGSKNAEKVSDSGTVTETGKMSPDGIHNADGTITSGLGNTYDAGGSSSTDGTAATSTKASKFAEMKF
jgi:hypothetical protein